MPLVRGRKMHLVIYCFRHAILIRYPRQKPDVIHISPLNASTCYHSMDLRWTKGWATQGEPTWWGQLEQSDRKLAMLTSRHARDPPTPSEREGAWWGLAGL